MPETTIRTKLRRWGNTFGIAVSPREVRRLRAKEGEEVTVRIQTEPAIVNYEDAGIFHFGHGTSKDHEKWAGAAVEEDRKRWHRA